MVGRRELKTEVPDVKMGGVEKGDRQGVERTTLIG